MNILAELIHYTELADALVIETFLATEHRVPEAEALFSHVLNAQHIWLSRINGTMPQHERFYIHPISAFESLHQSNTAGLKYVLAGNELSKLVDVVTQAGDRFQDTVQNILIHVCNHSTYHRAQVASYFRQHEITPPTTDFIHLKRQGLL